MNRLPETFGEFLLSLIPGATVLTAVDLIARTSLFMVYNPTSGVGQIFVALLLAFLVSQVLAIAADWVLRVFLIGLVFGYPSDNLLKPAKKAWYTRLFPQYFAGLPPEVASRLELALHTDGVFEPRGYFLHAYGRVLSDTEASIRLDKQQAEYFFSQSLAFSTVVVAFLAFFGMARGQEYSAVLFGASLMSTAFLFHRYLRGYRQYTLDLFLTYEALHAASASRGERPGERQKLGKAA